MRTATPIIQSVFLTLVFCTLSINLTSEAAAARLVKADISLDGNTVLEGSAGDNGRADADDVWEYLKSIKFKATKEFLKLKVKPDANETVLTSNAPRGQLGSIVVNISYGGKAIIRKLTLVRVPIDRQGREWRLDPAQVDKLFDDRLIRRSDAARLSNPRNSKSN